MGAEPPRWPAAVCRESVRISFFSGIASRKEGLKKRTLGRASMIARHEHSGCRVLRVGLGATWFKIPVFYGITAQLLNVSP